MSTLDVGELLDRATLAADARWPGASVVDVEPLQGGVSSLTFAARVARADAEDLRVVLKVAPPGLPPVRNRDVLRQARVLRALADAPGVRVPEIHLEDAGAPPFFVMGYVEGESYEPKLDAAAAPPDPQTVDARARAAARMLARLQQVAPADAGLADEPVLSPVEELERWALLYATTGDELRHDEQELHRALVETAPEPIEPSILHGDYRLGNMQFAGERLAAIIDWEIWSVGDPRHDLAWLLMWTDPLHRFRDTRDHANTRAGDAMPGREELLAEYLAVRSVDVADLDWFLACCDYKTAATTAALVKRARRQPEPDAAMETAATTLPAVLARGRELLAGPAGAAAPRDGAHHRGRAG